MTVTRYLTVVGARPQFIKASPVSKALRQAGIDEFLVHTGQHYDHNMSGIFFKDMNIPEPDVNLNTGSGSHAQQTAHMLVGLENLMQEHKPDCILVYGDTNSTLAGALAAVKLNIPVAHIEAGLRSFNRTMPEEHNRVLTDHCADMLFCPTQTAVDLLAREGITERVFLVGDTMYDALLEFVNIAEQRSTMLNQLNIRPQDYLLVTVHRPYNTDVPDHMAAILSVLAGCGENVVFPVHPRTRALLPEITLPPQVRLIDPVGYLDMLWLEKNARMILTDSGGIQKEAYFLKVPCITLRPETEWIETLQGGWNVLTGTDTERIFAALRAPRPQAEPQPVFGDGHAAERIIAALAKHFG
ncbi:MAG: UDP-N-acetylglucosamine 2-epimerase (non-hydrolyzing) [Anaerolineae bacterium]|nr:UDP-N-acetylglucosamine 2-epimerase (non-hydrolyzing) [Anaerolineae bacterium]